MAIQRHPVLPSSPLVAFTHLPDLHFAETRLPEQPLIELCLLEIWLL
jgi:hypothetical protein